MSVCKPLFDFGLLRGHIPLGSSAKTFNFLFSTNYDRNGLDTVKPPINTPSNKHIPKITHYKFEAITFVIIVRFSFFKKPLKGGNGLYNLTLHVSAQGAFVGGFRELSFLAGGGWSVCDRGSSGPPLAYCESFCFLFEMNDSSWQFLIIHCNIANPWSCQQRRGRNFCFSKSQEFPWQEWYIYSLP